MRAQIQAHVRQVGGLGPEVELIKEPNGIKILEESFEKGVYKVKGSVPLADVMEYAHAMRNKADRAAAKKGGEKAAPAPKEGAPGAPDAPADGEAKPPAGDAAPK